MNDQPSPYTAPPLDPNSALEIRTIQFPQGQIMIATNPFDDRIPSKWKGTTTVQTNMGQLNVSFDLPVVTLKQAIEVWHTHAQAAVKDAIDKIRSEQLRKQILTPGSRPA